MSEIAWHDTLTAEQVAQVDALLDRVRDEDGVSAISEHAYLHLLAGGGHGDRHALLTAQSGVIGYAHLSADDQPVAELLVDPAARGRGEGSRLLREVLAAGGADVRIWAHGRLPAAEALAQRLGLRAVRTLCVYRRPLQQVPEPQWPQGIAVRGFEDADADEWLALNQVAFQDLPDQGSWTIEDLRRRLDAPWFDPEGFLMAFDAEGLAGFHWTKVHGGAGHDHDRIGEVYVLAVAPRARGTGLARALTAAGLGHLQRQGVASVILYVDAANTAAVSLYTAMGFTRTLCDVQFAPQ